ncbi:hypothetical protein G7Y41_07015 [Schaalia sp. ZJ405]|uniref:hypothetical protein n=1 Tax=Schaalia sp. ZJ405 TaxID=2709403 RepID=UPI0013EC8092|nr:hypothetical protein [Schaalia sp. ZJ405]QPK80805.1 hypothetical protein G7Y41_07015 [Schaalia sp. ZJ405]
MTTIDLIRHLHATASSITATTAYDRFEAEQQLKDNAYGFIDVLLEEIDRLTAISQQQQTPRQPHEN